MNFFELQLLLHFTAVLYLHLKCNSASCLPPQLKFNSNSGIELELKGHSQFTALTSVLNIWFRAFTPADLSAVCTHYLIFVRGNIGSDKNTTLPLLLFRPLLGVSGPSIGSVLLYFQPTPTSSPISGPAVSTEITCPLPGKRPSC